MDIVTMLRKGQTVYLYQAELGEMLVSARVENLDRDVIGVEASTQVSADELQKMALREITLRWEIPGGREECPVLVTAVEGTLLKLRPRVGDRREFLRIRVTLPLFYEVIAATRAPQVAREIVESTGIAQSFDSDVNRFLHGEDLSEQMEEQFAQVMRMLKQVDAKLDYLIDVAEGRREPGGRPNMVILLDISGAGLSFVNLGEIPVGSFLRMLIQVNRFPMIEIPVVGKVQRCLNVSESEGEGKFEIGVSFEAIRESDRENIFRFISRMERRILRERRESMLAREAS
ncbi:MAG TPA: PilZ domain-containing protein [Candidatus Sumerlaeota bacterium]|nr:PilZ domain-containing protein [Candidatus Sumerlaeota bacterium]HPS02427.1 PilZ domain-containing protein [Candidatus Sumerlaeota bacterium]